MKMKPRTIITIFLIIFYSAKSFSQKINEDVLYLKNGSIIRGVIIEQIINQSIKIQTKDRNVFVFKYEEIEKITKENNNNSFNHFNKDEIKKDGFTNITELLVSPSTGAVKINNGIIKNNNYSFGIRTINGYQFNEHLSIGIGIGIEKYIKATLLPISFDVRANILKGKTTPFINSNFGYSLGINDSEGGMIFNPSIGVRTYIRKNIAYVFSLGLKWQGQETVYNSLNNGQLTTFSNIVYFRYISINTGIIF